MSTFNFRAILAILFVWLGISFKCLNFRAQNTLIMTVDSNVDFWNKIIQSSVLGHINLDRFARVIKFDNEMFFF